MRDTPRLSWINIKTRPRSGESQKNRPGRENEHIEARLENIDWIAAQEKKNDERENQAIDRAENEGMGAGTQRPEQSL